LPTGGNVGGESRAATDVVLYGNGIAILELKNSRMTFGDGNIAAQCARMLR
jgi:hypothetical protein